MSFKCNLGMLFDESFFYICIKKTYTPPAFFCIYALFFMFSWKIRSFTVYWVHAFFCINFEVDGAKKECGVYYEIIRHNKNDKINGSKSDLWLVRIFAVTHYLIIYNFIQKDKVLHFKESYYNLKKKSFKKHTIKKAYILYRI